MKDRNEFPELLTSHGCQIGVEVGTFKGKFAKTILDGWDGLLYMVDAWRPLGAEYQDMSNDARHRDAFADTMKSIAGYEHRAIMIRALSMQAVNLFEPESLDFVYIDANHSYNFVKQDIEAWERCVKPGGIIAGHDYLDVPKDERVVINGKFYGVYGVKPAADEFCKENGYKVNLTDEKFATWWVIK